MPFLLETGRRKFLKNRCYRLVFERDSKNGIPIRDPGSNFRSGSRSRTFET